MQIINQPKSLSQVISFIFHFPSKKLHLNIIIDGIRVELTGKLIPFDRLSCFYWLEDENNPDKDVLDLVLDYEHNANDTIKMELTPEVLELMPGVDLSTIDVRIYGKKKAKREPLRFYDIEFIIISAEVEDKTKTYDRYGQIINNEKSKDGAERSPQVYGGPGVEDWDRHQNKKDESKKPDLYIVPKPGDRKKKAKRRPQVPKEIMQFSNDHYARGEWKRILRGVHKFSIYRARKEDKHYPGKSKRKNRQYVFGQEWLADKLGLSRWTVGRWFERFEDDGLIYCPYRGYMDRGASIIELAYTEGHRRKNKRETGKR